MSWVRVLITCKLRGLFLVFVLECEPLKTLGLECEPWENTWVALINLVRV